MRIIGCQLYSQSLPPRPMSSVRITGNRECSNKTESINRIVCASSLVKNVIILDLFRNPLQKGQRLIKSHGECDSGEVLGRKWQGHQARNIVA